MLAWIAQYHYRGDGVICDLGSFAGGSTIHLAYGLRQSGRQGKVLAYDRFHCPETQKYRWLYSKGISPFEGTDILDVVRALLSEFLDIVELSQGEFQHLPAPGKPIEICFVDIAKTLNTNEHIVREYFTRLIPGRSIVIQQDYLFISPPWDIATMEILQDHFELLSHTEENSAVFLCTKRITPGDAEKVSAAALKKKNLADLIRTAKGRFPYWKQKEMLELAALAYDANPKAENSWTPVWRLQVNKQQYDAACSGNASA